MAELGRNENISVEKSPFSSTAEGQPTLLKLREPETRGHLTVCRRKEGFPVEGTNVWVCKQLREKTCAKCSPEDRPAPRHPSLLPGTEPAAAGFPAPPRGAQSTLSQISFTLWLNSSGWSAYT